MFLATIKNRQGKTIHIEETVIMELWSRLMEQGWWNTPKNSMYDMETEKEWIDHIDEGLDPKGLRSFSLYKREDGRAKIKILEIDEENMSERREILESLEKEGKKDEIE